MFMAFAQVGEFGQLNLSSCEDLSWLQIQFHRPPLLLCRPFTSTDGGGGGARVLTVSAASVGEIVDKNSSQKGFAST